MSFEPTKATKTTKKQPAKTNINNTNHQQSRKNNIFSSTSIFYSEKLLSRTPGKK